jgi:heat shock protein HtpX
MWEQIQANRRRSAVLITLMVVALAILGYVAGEALLGPGGGVMGLGLALIIWGIQMGIYYTAAESVLLGGAYARQLTREDNPQLFNIVDEMVIASGLGFTPRVYLIDDPGPNAFAIGRKPENSAVAVTTGLLQRLNRDELQGVIAHEIGHLKNRDVQFMTLAAIMLGSIAILSEIVLRSMRFGGRGRSRSDSRGGGQGAAILAVIAIVFAILGPLMAQLLYFACSRKREFLADASAAQFTRYPDGLASALEKISGSRVNVSFANKVTAPMFIINPLAAAGSGASLFSTHPSTTERVRILRGMGGASFADYEAAYRQAEGKGLLDARTLSATAPVAARQPSVAPPVMTRSMAAEAAQRAFGYVRLHCNCGLETSVPESYQRDSIRCVRCGNSLLVPSVSPLPDRGEGQGEGVALQYHRATDGWESFRCQCGRTVQLSPAFSAPRVRCTGCGATINVVSSVA